MWVNHNNAWNWVSWKKHLQKCWHSLPINVGILLFDLNCRALISIDSSRRTYFVAELHCREMTKCLAVSTFECFHRCSWLTNRSTCPLLTCHHRERYITFSWITSYATRLWLDKNGRIKNGKLQHKWGHSSNHSKHSQIFVERALKISCEAAL